MESEMEGDDDEVIEPEPVASEDCPVAAIPLSSLPAPLAKPS